MDCGRAGVGVARRPWTGKRVRTSRGEEADRHQLPCEGASGCRPAAARGPGTTRVRARQRLRDDAGQRRRRTALGAAGGQAQAAEATAPYSPCTSRQRREEAQPPRAAGKTPSWGSFVFLSQFKGPWAGVSQCLILTQSHSRSLVSPNTEAQLCRRVWGQGEVGK